MFADILEAKKLRTLHYRMKLAAAAKRAAATQAGDTVDNSVTGGGSLPADSSAGAAPDVNVEDVVLVEAEKEEIQSFMEENVSRHWVMVFVAFICLLLAASSKHTACLGQVW